MMQILENVSIALAAGLLWGLPAKGAGAPFGPRDYAIFAGGCFWCLQPPFEQRSGVIEVLVGYTGGKGAKPNYQDYADTGHLEAIKVSFDPSKVSYAELLELFLRQIDPTDGGGQFVDRGPQYRPAIFFRGPQQKREAEKALAGLKASGVFSGSLQVPLLPEQAFFPAEDYHQAFYRKSPEHYRRYRAGAGRDSFLEKVWKHRQAQPKATPADSERYKVPSKAEIKKKLDPLACHVTQEDGTEPPFDNAFWDNHRAGIYVDVVSGEPLFSSLDKFDSGTGWPSFTRPLAEEAILARSDMSAGMRRTEVRSRRADSHLGHVFPDGPAPTGLRYCINSAALRFVAKEDLAREGYGDYLRLFEGGQRGGGHR